MDISSLFGSSGGFADIIRARQQVQAQRVDANASASAVKKAINGSNFLDKGGKQTLTNLTDTVSQYAEGNTKLLRDIQGISNLMQLGAKEQVATDTASAVTQVLKARYLPGSFLDTSA